MSGGRLGLPPEAAAQLFEERSHSARSAVIGWTRVARRAGTNVAKSETTVMSAITEA